MTAEEPDPPSLPISGDGPPLAAEPLPSGDDAVPQAEVAADVAPIPTTDPAPAPAAETGPGAVLTESLSVAAGSSRLLRKASIYIGLLMLALAGPGVVAVLALLGSSVDIFDPTAPLSDDVASDAGRAGILIVIALVGAIIASVEGAAIGITLLAGRVLDRPISLAAALQRSRQVFWRIIRAGLIVGAVQAGASLVWGLATGTVQIDDLSGFTNEPLLSAIATLPFVWATVAIVLADDGARAALRRSASIASRTRRLTVALGLFGLLAGVVQGFALGSGLDLIIRVMEALQLDITAGGFSFVLAGALALAIVMAAGSLFFTVTALVNAPQIVAWQRLGLPLDGLPALPVGAEPPAEAPTEAPTIVGSEAAPGPEAMPGLVTAPVVAAAAAMAAKPEPGAEPAAAQPPEPTPALAPSPAPAASGWGQPEAPAPSAWELGAAREQPFHWVTVPMRLTVIGMWLIAIVSLVADRST